MPLTDIDDLILRRMTTLEEGHQLIQANLRDALETMHSVQALLTAQNGRIGKTEHAVEALKAAEHTRQIGEATASGIAKGRGDILVSRKGGAMILGMLGAIPTVITTVTLLLTFKT